METKQLTTFVTLSKERSYQKASVVLNYAPSTLAKHIRALEEELNVKLAERMGTHIEITDEGKKFLPHAEQMLKDYNYMISDFSNKESIAPSIRIAGGEPLVGYSFSDVLLDFFKENSTVGASVEMICCSEIPQMIMDNEIDMGYIHDMNILKPLNLDVVPLYREEVCLVSTPRNPLIGKSQIDYGDFAGMDFAFTYGDCSFCAEFIGRMKKRNIIPRSSLLLGSYMSVLNSVRCDDRITLIPSTSLPQILAEGFVRLNWTAEPLLPWVQLLYSTERPLTRYQQVLIDRTRGVAEQRIAESNKQGVVGYVR